MSDLRPSLDSVFGAFAVDVTVSPRNQAAIETEGVWIGFDMPPTEFKERRRRLMTLRKRDVPVLFRGDRIDAPEQRGELVLAWMVDEFIHSDNEVWRVVVQQGEVAGG